MEDTILSWTAPEFIKHPRGKGWFILAGLFVVGLISYAFKTQSWTMAIAFIVLAGVYNIAHHREAKDIRVKINNLGIQAGQRNIPYNHIRAFWIVYQPPDVKVLKLLTTDKWMAEMTIQLDGQDPGPVREMLVKEVPEYEGKSESLVDVIIRQAKL